MIKIIAVASFIYTIVFSACHARGNDCLQTINRCRHKITTIEQTLNHVIQAAEKSGSEQALNAVSIHNDRLIDAKVECGIDISDACS
ncbi:MAG: hypothetical protein HN353_08715 [Bdellovibrionales bacterium]|jgi:hypothetical protein|nr:hypothetical protein [Bdellovibrionales bacterium]MBT3526903.1 hypothetical protein [Bdellovibrionales bacterium]MBT7669649.1 hypothetical protein [Bdellovibrionales bacterium]MBT7767284.1 hypothetical protein [Bdellovibrionales bacterium]